MNASEDFPRLTNENHRVTSPATPDYNCIAWAAMDMLHWWQPGIYWPINVADDDYGIGTLEQLFASFGYVECSNSDYEPDYEKLALYGTTLFYTHAARQLSTGKWTSKLGRCEDIEHDTPDDVAGGLYGEVVQLMSRPISA